MKGERIVAVALLTETNLQMLGRPAAFDTRRPSDGV